MKQFTVNVSLTNLTDVTTASYVKIMTYCANRPTTRKWLNSAQIGETHTTVEPPGEKPRTITRIA